MTAEERAELGELCDALVDGRLRAGDRDRLNAILAGSEEARRFYVRSAGLSSSLHEYAAEILTGEVTPLVRPWGWWAKIAAGIVLGGMSLFLLRPDSDRGTVARISGVLDCRWEGRKAESGESVESGRVLKLESGSCELTLDSGARVVLEGPAEMRVLSAWEVILERGFLNAVVPAEAQGFRVENAEMAVEGGGGEFSVAVEDENSAVCGHRGAVAAGSGERGMAVLAEQESRRFSRGQSGEVRGRDFKLSRLRKNLQWVRTAQPLGGQHWGFEKDQEGDGTRRGGKLALGGAAVSGQGVRGSAVRISGEHPLAVQVPWVGDLTEWSCAFWIRHAEPGVPAVGGLLRVGGEDGIQFGANTRPSRGPMGALAVLSGNALKRQATGQKSVFDGQWHHVVLEFSVRSAKSSRVQVKQYVDGRLEGGGVLRQARGRHGSGRAWDRLEFSGPGSELDELWVFDRALMPSESLHLRMSHELPTPGSMAGL